MKGTLVVLSVCVFLLFFSPLAFCQELSFCTASSTSSSRQLSPTLISSPVLVGSVGIVLVTSQEKLDITLKDVFPHSVFSFTFLTPQKIVVSNGRETRIESVSPSHSLFSPETVSHVSALASGVMAWWESSASSVTPPGSECRFLEMVPQKILKKLGKKLLLRFFLGLWLGGCCVGLLLGDTSWKAGELVWRRPLASLLLGLLTGGMVVGSFALLAASYVGLLLWPSGLFVTAFVHVCTCTILGIVLFLAIGKKPDSFVARMLIPMGFFPVSFVVMALPKIGLVLFLLFHLLALGSLILVGFSAQDPIKNS